MVLLLVHPTPLLPRNYRAEEWVPSVVKFYDEIFRGFSTKTMNKSMLVIIILSVLFCIDWPVII